MGLYLDHQLLDHALAFRVCSSLSFRVRYITRPAILDASGGSGKGILTRISQYAQHKIVCAGWAAS